MKKEATHRMDTDHCVEGDFSHSPTAAILHAHELARELKGLLDQEAQLLRRFESHELMGIIHRKASLIVELTDKLRVLKETDGRQTDAGQDPRYDHLAACLKEIAQMNLSNRIFIEGTLSHFQDFVDTLLPASYAPRNPNEVRKDLATFKGLMLTKEI